ncbi:Spy/CpxP family protein refolding chaperone [Bacteroides sp. ET225]|uniref:Spy/CpxP family protein refolding chaperone n=1 Tax=Bacteroides sp. ET225 TaxID=2972461 RepID=UPI0021ABCAC9|nr:Spy/CpxP family protein refolding chaperone [Bacteroides sp. ET225]MCR8917627.1 Spy/CpxP family protein refolding chaperone [Bacteroides sp. ET225]
MKKNLVIMGMISALLSSPFSSILACENESVWSMAVSDRKSDHKGPGASMLTDELIKALSLSDEQVEKWKKIESGLQEKMEAMRPDRNSGERPDPEKMREKMDSMMQAYDAAVKKILSDEQYEQFQAYREKNRPKGRPGHRPEMDGPDREFEDEMF